MSWPWACVIITGIVVAGLVFFAGIVVRGQVKSTVAEHLKNRDKQ